MAFTRDEIAAVIDLEADDDASLWISLAENVAGEYIVGSLPTGRLDQIKIFLAAHFAAIKYHRGMLTRDRQGDAEQAYQVRHEDLHGLSETVYGRQAVALDSTGALSALSRAPVHAKFRVV